MVVGVSAMLVGLMVHRARVPRYEGRAIDYWFAGLPVTLVLSNGSVMRATNITVNGQAYVGDASRSLAAFDYFGADGVLYLMRMLEGRDSAVETKAREIVWKLGGGRYFPARIADVQRGQAVTALISLQELPQDTLRRLNALSNDVRPEVARAARHVVDTRAGEAGSRPVTTMRATNVTFRSFGRSGQNTTVKADAAEVVVPNK